MSETVQPLCFCTISYFISRGW